MPLSRSRRQHIKRRDRATMRRAVWLKMNGPCKHCGTWDNLTVDHVDPDTKDPRLKLGSGKAKANMWRWSAEALAAELAKCQVLCLPCHRIKDGCAPKQRKEQP